MNSLISRNEILEWKGKTPEVDSEIFDLTHAYIYESGTEGRMARLRSLPIGYQTVYDLIVVEGEICNGGFSQYFSNSTAEEHHYSGVEAFKRIGALKIAALLEDAFERVLTLSPSFRVSYGAEGIQEAFNNIQDIKIDFSDLDKKFYELMDTQEKLGDLRVAYVFNNLQEF